MALVFPVRVGTYLPGCVAIPRFNDVTRRWNGNLRSVTWLRLLPTDPGKCVNIPMKLPREAKASLRAVTGR